MHMTPLLYRHSHTCLLPLLTMILLLTLFPGDSDAMPVFARKSDMSCSTCHSAFPRLNEFGEQFAADNMRLPNWRDTTKSGGNDMLALPQTGNFYSGHLTGEDYALVGFDAAF